MPPKSGEVGKESIDPLVKPKPGQKPKPARPAYAANNVQARQPAAPSQGQAKRTVVPTPDQQKLILCRYYEQGLCERGSACWFAHGKDELRHPQKHAIRQEMQAHKPPPPIDSDSNEQCPDEALFKTRMCVYFQQGRCQRGSSCTFAHDPAELQSFDRARRNNNQQKTNTRPLTLDQYLPQQLHQERSGSQTSSPDRSAASARAAAIAPPAVPPPSKGSAATARCNSQPLGPRIAQPRSYVPSMPASPARTNGYNLPEISPESISAQFHFEDREELAGGNGYDAAISLENSLGDLSLGEGDDDAEAPQSFCCPITTELLVDPVVAADGHTYERHDITEWLKKNDTSPMTNERMEHKHLIPNLALRAVMDAYFGVRS